MYTDVAGKVMEAAGDEGVFNDATVASAVWLKSSRQIGELLYNSVSSSERNLPVKFSLSTILYYTLCKYTTITKQQ